MEILDNVDMSLHLVLKKLIEEKSQRDNISFTASQLAAALGMPRSMITKLTHQNKLKRVTNPRIDTLLKIIDFFRTDGFNISIEDLLGMNSRSIEINNELSPANHPINISLVEFDNHNNKLGTFEICLNFPVRTSNILALQTNRDIKPFFKTGSIFIIDKDSKPEDDTLIAIKLDNCNEVFLKKYHIVKNKIILKSLDNTEQDIILLPTSQCKIIGVVIQVNAKT